MRRILAIAAVVLFWLAPVAALLPGSDDAQLPACCRRHGAHHCAMSMGMAEQALPGHWFAIPNHCPRYSVSPTLLLKSFLAPRPASLAASGGPGHVHQADQAVRPFPITHLTARGPPASC